MSDTEVVVDASVIVKWFVEEEHSNEVLDIRDKYVEGGIKVIASLSDSKTL